MLEELRKKSKGTKDAYAFWGALLVTGVVGLVWAATLSVRFSEVGTVSEVENVAESAGAMSQFFQKMKEGVADTWQRNRQTLEEMGQSEEVGADPEPAENDATASSSPAVEPNSSSTIRTFLIATSSEPSR